MDSGSSYTPAIIEDPAHSNFTYMASQLGCGNITTPASKMLSCMRKLNVAMLEKFLLDHKSTTPSIAFLPVADEKVAFSNYTQRAIDGFQAELPAIIGGNAQDGVPFAPYNPSGVNTTVALYENLVNFFCPQTQTIKSRQLAGLPTYRYYYHGNFSNISPRGWEGAYHCAELPMIMGTHNNYRGAGSALEDATSIAMQDAYLAFAAHGTEGLVKENWQPYSELGEPTVRAFGDGIPAKNINLTHLEELCVGYRPVFSI
ncbi:acetylcholinesterase, partial [Aureobasidium melanogenum]